MDYETIHHGTTTSNLTESTESTESTTLLAMNVPSTRLPVNNVMMNDMMDEERFVIDRTLCRIVYRRADDTTTTSDISSGVMELIGVSELRLNAVRHLLEYTPSCKYIVLPCV